MDFRRRISWTRVALVVVLAVGGPLTAGAQGQRGAVAEPYTPGANAKDLKAVLFHWMWGMGMLKGHDERDMVASLEYQGKGTIQVDGQPCTLTRYRTSTNYQTFSQRIQYACTRPNGQTYSNIEVVSGLYAWNEDTLGAEIGPTKGKTTPMPGTLQERLIRIWASPQGAPKAAVAGTTETFWLGANPGTLFDDGVAKVGQTSVSWEAGKPVVTFPIPGVPGATATATLDAKYMTDRVVVTQGSTTTEFTYAGYQDWNNPLNKIGVLYAGKMVERRNGAVVRDLTTEVTETGNVYVVAPVPASVKTAIKVTGQIPRGVFAKTAPSVYKSDTDITFLYSGGDAGGGYPEFRVIPTDGRPHSAEASFDMTYLGNTTGRWEGDTLVLDSIGFIDTTWLGRGGFFHSDQMHVVERFTRQGDAILYDVTVEDPEVLVEPWVLPTRTIRRNTNPDAGLLRERGNCEIYEDGAAVTQIRH